MEMFETDHHVHLDKVNQLIDDALADMEVERARVDISWISRYGTQLQAIAIALHEARQAQEIDEHTYLVKNATLTFLANDIAHEEQGLRERHPNWDKMNMIQREEAIADYFDRAKISEYMEKLEELAFRESFV
jgi:hypothetical protein